MEAKISSHDYQVVTSASAIATTYLYLLTNKTTADLDSRYESSILSSKQKQAQILSLLNRLALYFSDL